MLLGSYEKRFISGLAAGLFGLLIVGLGGWWFTFAVGLIVQLALLEFFRMAEFTGIRPATKTTLVACQLLLVLTQLACDGHISYDLVGAVLPLSGAAVCGWLLLQPVTGSIADIAASIFGLFYLGFLPSHWLKLRSLISIDLPNDINLVPSIWPEIYSSGMIITLISCLMIVATDIGSYAFGIKFGSTPLSPISPSKTIEGALGGFFSSILLGGIFGVFLEWKYGFLIGAFLGFLIAFFALIGDLVESMMKRDAGIKDSGNVLPGHGGILDRIDSYLFTPAVVYYTLILIHPVFN